MAYLAISVPCSAVTAGNTSISNMSPPCIQIASNVPML